MNLDLRYEYILTITPRWLYYDDLTVLSCTAVHAIVLPMVVVWLSYGVGINMCLLHVPLYLVY